MSYNQTDLRTYSKQQLIDLLTSDIAGWNKLYNEARRASDYTWAASLDGASLDGASLCWASLDGASLNGASLNGARLDGANLNGASLNGEPITVSNWCDLLDLAHAGKNLRVAFKRLPADRITGRKYKSGKHLIEWKSGKWVEAPDWNDNAECGGGLHLSPTPAATRAYSGESLVIAVAFDPQEAVLLGDKVKARRVKVLA